MFLFMDFETTGLDPRFDKPVEVALIVADENTEITERDRISIAIHSEPEWWHHVNPKVIAMHKKSGVMERSLASPYTFGETEELLMEVVLRHDARYRVLAGSSVHFDRRFIESFFPRLYGVLFHRQFDVSSLYPVVFNIPGFPTHAMKKESEKPHEALADVEASMNIARHYMKAFGRHLAITQAAELWREAVRDYEKNNNDFTTENLLLALQQLKRRVG